MPEAVRRRDDEHRLECRDRHGAAEERRRQRAKHRVAAHDRGGTRARGRRPRRGRRRTDVQGQQEESGHKKGGRIGSDKNLGLDEREDKCADRRCHQHARFKEPAVDRVDAQQPGCRGHARDACGIARLGNRSEESGERDRHENRPDRAGAREAQRGGGEGALSQRATSPRPGSDRSDRRVSHPVSDRAPAARTWRGCTAPAPPLGGSDRRGGRRGRRL